MKKNSNKKLLLSVALPLVAISSSILVSCYEENKNNQNNQTFNNSTSIANAGRVKYIAFGDSFSAGTSSELSGFSSPGELKEDGTITGLSYPAFIASYIKELDPNKLESFENFSLDSTTIGDWLYILNEPEFTYEKSQKSFEYLERFDKQKDNIDKGRIARQFKSFAKDQEVRSDFIDFVTKLSDANLITISLGATDLLNALEIQNLFENILGSKKDLFRGQNVLDILKNTSENIKTNLTTLLTRVRKLNPTANISLIGYTLPLLRLAKTLDSLVKLENGQKFSKIILETLNATIKDVAKDTNVNYINTYDEVFWSQNSDKLSKYFYDIYPTTKGYKKIAQDILLKMALGDNFQNDKSFEVAQRYNSSWDREYYNSDKDSYSQQLAFIGFSNSDIALNVLGNSDLRNLWVQSSLEANPTVASKLIYSNNSSTNVVYNWVLANPDRINSLIPFIIGFFDNNSSTQRQLKSFLEKKTEGSQTNLYKLALTFAESGYLDRVFRQVQDDLNRNDYDKNGLKGTQNVSDKVLGDLFFKKIFDSSNLHILIKAFLKSDLVVSQKQGVKDFLRHAFQLFLKSNDLFKRILNLSNEHQTPESAERLNKFISVATHFLRNSSEANKLINILINDLIDNANVYANTNSLKQLFDIFLNKNRKPINTSFGILVKQLSQNNQVLNAISDVAYGFIVDELNIDNVSEDQKNRVKKLIYQVIKTNPKLFISSNAEDSFFNFLKSSNFFNTDNETKGRKLIQLFQNNLNDLINIFFSIIKNPQIELKDIAAFINLIFTNLGYKQLSNVSLDVSGTLVTLLNKINTEKLNKTAKDKLIFIVKTAFDSLINNSNVKSFVNLYVTKISETISESVTNSINNFELTDSLSSIINSILLNSINSGEIKQIIVDVLDDILNNSELYAKAKNLNDVLDNLLNSKSFDISNKMDKIINNLLAKKDIIDNINKATQELLKHTLFNNSALSADEQKAISTIVTKALNNLTKLKIYKETKERVLTYVKANLSSLLNGDSAKVEELKNIAITNITKPENVVDSLFQLLLEENENKITIDDVNATADVLLNHLSISKLTKATSRRARRSLPLNVSSIVSSVYSFVKTVVKSKYINTNTNATLAESEKLSDEQVQANKETIKQIIQSLISKVFANNNVQSEIRSYIIEQIALLLNLGDTKDENLMPIIDKLVSSVFGSEDFKALVSQLFTNLIDKSEVLATKNSFKEVFLEIIKDSDFETKFTKIFNETLDNVVSDTKVVNSIVDLSYRLITSNVDSNKITTTESQAAKSLITKVIGLFKNFDVYSKIKDSVIRFVTSGNILDGLTNPDGITPFSVTLPNGQPSNDAIISLSTSDIVTTLMAIIKDKTITSEELNSFAKLVVANFKLDDLNGSSNNANKWTNQNLIDIFVDFIKQIANTSLEADDQTKFTSLITTVFSSIIENESVIKHVNNLAQKLSQTFSDNLLYLISSFKIKDPAKIKTNIDKLVKNVVNNAIKLNETQAIAVGLFKDLVQNSNHYKNITNVNDLFNKFLTSSSLKLSEKIDDLITKLLSDEAFINILIDTVESVLVATIFKGSSLTSSEQAHLAKSIKNILSQLTSLNVYQELKTNILDYVSKNLNEMLKGDANKLNELKEIFIAPFTKTNSIINFTFDIIFQSKTDSKVTKLSEEDVVNLADIFLNHVSFEQIAKVETINNFISQPLPTIAKQIHSFIKTTLTSKYLNNAYNGADKLPAALIAQNKKAIKSIFKSVLIKALSKKNLFDQIKLVLTSYVERFISKNLHSITSQDVQVIIDTLFNSIVTKDGLQNIITIIFDELVDHSEKYLSEDKFISMLKKLIIAKEQQIKPHVKNILDELVLQVNKNTRLTNILGNKVYQLLIDNLNISNISNADQKELKAFITKVFKHLPSLNVTSKLTSILFSFIKNANFVDVLDNYVVDLDITKVLTLTKNDVFEIILSLVKNNNISSNEFSKFVSLIVKNFTFDSVALSNTNLSSFDLRSIDKYVATWFEKLAAANLNAQQQAKITAIIKAVFDELLKNKSFKPTIDSFINSTATTLTNQAFTIFSNLKLPLDKNANIKNSINKTATTLISTAIYSPKLSQIINEISADILKNSNKYKNVKSISDVLGTFLNTSTLKVSEQIDILLKDILTNSNFIDSFVDTSELLLQATIFENKKFSQAEKTNFKNIVTKLFNGLTDLTIYKSIKEKLLTFVKTNYDKLLKGDSKTVEQLKAVVLSELGKKDILIDTIFQLLLEKNSSQINANDIGNLVDLFVSHISFDKPIFKGLNKVSVNFNDLAANAQSLLKAILNSKYLTTDKNAAQNKTVIKNVIATILDKVFSNNGFALKLQNYLMGYLKTSLLNKVKINDQDLKTILSSLYNSLVNVGDFKGLINAMVSEILDNSTQYSKLNSIFDIYNKVIVAPKLDINNRIAKIFDSVVKNLVKDKTNLTALSNVAYAFLVDKLKVTNVTSTQEKQLKSFISSFIGKLPSLHIYPELMNIFIAFVKYGIFNKNQVSIVEILSDITPEVYVKTIINFVKSSDATVEDFKTVATILAQNIDLKSFAVLSDPKSRINRENIEIDKLSSEVVRQFASAKFTNEQQDKFKVFAVALFENIFKNKSIQGTLNKWINDLATKGARSLLYALFDTRVDFIEITPHVQEIVEVLVKEVSQNSSIKDLINIVLDDILKNKFNYKDVKSLNNIFNKILLSPTINISSQLDKIFTSLLSSQSLIEKFTNLFLQVTTKTVLDGAKLTEDDKKFINNIIKKVSLNLLKTDVYEKSKIFVLKLLTDNPRFLLDNPEGFLNIVTEEIRSIIKTPYVFVDSVLQVILTNDKNDISVSDVSRFIDIILKAFDVSKTNELVFHSKNKVVKTQDVIKNDNFDFFVKDFDVRHIIKSDGLKKAIKSIPNWDAYLYKNALGAKYNGKVKLEILEDSFSLNNKSFKVKATPINSKGFKWSDNTNGVKVIEVFVGALKNAPKSEINMEEMFDNVKKYLDLIANSPLLKTNKANLDKVQSIVRVVVEKIFTNDKMQKLFTLSVWDNVKDKMEFANISKKDLEEIMTRLFQILNKNSYITNLITGVFNDFTNNNNNNIYKNATNLRQIVKTFFNGNGKDMFEQFKNIISEVLSDDVFATMLAKVAIAKFKLQNVNKKDIENLSALIKTIVPHINSIPDFKGVYDSFINLFKEHNVDLFTTKLTSIVREWTNVFSSLDIYAIIEKLGDKISRNEVNSILLINVFNMFVSKSPLPRVSDITSENSPFFYMLTRINKTKNRDYLDVGKFIKSWLQIFFEGKEDENAIVGGTIATISESVFNMYLRWKTLNPKVAMEKNPYFKAIARMISIVLWLTWETKFREPQADKSLFWGNPLGSAVNQIYSFFTKYANSKEMTKILDHVLGNRNFNSVNQNNYKPNDLIWMIRNYGEIKDYKYVVDNNRITLQDRIFQIIKNGSWTTDDKSNYDGLDADQINFIANKPSNNEDINNNKYVTKDYDINKFNKHIHNSATFTKRWNSLRVLTIKNHWRGYQNSQKDVVYELDLRNKRSIPEIQHVELKMLTNPSYVNQEDLTGFFKVTAIDENNKEIPITVLSPIKRFGQHYTYYLNIYKRVKNIKITFIKGKQPLYPSINDIKIKEIIRTK